jgi:hypothetical protein
MRASPYVTDEYRRNASVAADLIMCGLTIIEFQTVTFCLLSLEPGRIRIAGHVACMAEKIKCTQNVGRKICGKETLE